MTSSPAFVPAAPSARLLLRSWLASLHGHRLELRPATGDLPGLPRLGAQALLWSGLQLVVALVGTAAVARSGSPVGHALADAGRVGVLGVALGVWLLATAVGTALWWRTVRRA